MESRRAWHVDADHFHEPLSGMSSRREPLLPRRASLSLCRAASDAPLGGARRDARSGHRKFDAIVTCFFLDTVVDIAELVTVLDSLLDEGGAPRHPPHASVSPLQVGRARLLHRNGLGCASGGDAATPWCFVPTMAPR